jgi:hypothetical protein
VSWKIEYLLKNQESIRSNIIKKEEIYFINNIQEYHYENDFESDYIFESLVEYDFENDIYTDLLLIEETIEELKIMNKISEEEYKIIKLIENNTPPNKMEEIIGMDKRTIYKIFSIVCERLAFLLGGEFTNSGTIEKICKERKGLTGSQIEIVRRYLDKNTVSKFI